VEEACLDNQIQPTGRQMTAFLENGRSVGSSRIPRIAVLLAVALIGIACEEAGEIKDDFDSSVVCGDFCDKKFDCADTKPSDVEKKACVDKCRNSIEDDCGNDHQEAATEQIAECVDMGCTEFSACMIFDVAPECFGFVE
jgi:hypothetical protein